MKAKDYFFIVNPAAGRGKKLKVLPEIEAFFRKRNLDFQMVLTKAPKHAKEIAKKAVKDGYKTIVAVGGDGTINEVLSGIAGHDVLLGIVPIGSGNDYIKNIDFPKNLNKNLEALINKKFKQVDIGLINNKYYFANAFSVGFDGEAASRVKNFSFIPNSFLAYLLSVFRTLATYEFPKVKVSLDNDIKFENGMLLIAVSIGKCYGGGFKIAPSAKIDDGIFTVCFIEKCSRFYALRNIPKVMKGTHTELPIVKIYTSKYVKIKSESLLTAQIDGEILPLDKSFEVRILPKCLKVIIP